jgi:8-oxo-dGTP pyrophosphatase MutT (NUDIX family)
MKYILHSLIALFPPIRGFTSKAVTGTYGRHATWRMASTETVVASDSHHRCSSVQQDAQIMQHMLYRVRQVNSMPDDVRKSLLDFRVDHIHLGRVTPTQAQRLCDPDHNVFEIQDDPHDGTPYLTLASSAGTTPESRTEAVASVMNSLRAAGNIPAWRNEGYPITSSFYDTPIFVMERAAVPQLGGIEYGVHMNGLVRNTDGSTHMWMARRSATKAKYPNMLDQMVAGGQPVGLSLYDNVVKECWEEASIPPELTRQVLRAAGAVSYETYNAKTDTISRAVLFHYDLHLPSTFVPTPVDGEVQEFFLWTVPQILASMDPEYPDPIKPNCYSCIIDWLIRDGHVSPDVPGYLDVVRELRSGSCQ